MYFFKIQSEIQVMFDGFFSDSPNLSNLSHTGGAHLTGHPHPPCDVLARCSWRMSIWPFEALRPFAEAVYGLGNDIPGYQLVEECIAIAKKHLIRGDCAGKTWKPNIPKTWMFQKHRIEFRKWLKETANKTRTIAEDYLCRVVRSILEPWDLWDLLLLGLFNEENSDCFLFESLIIAVDSFSNLNGWKLWLALKRW